MVILLVPLPTLNQLVPPSNIIPAEEFTEITVPSLVAVAPAVPFFTPVLSVLVSSLQLGLPFESVFHTLFMVEEVGAATIPAVFKAFNGISRLDALAQVVEALVLYSSYLLVIFIRS